MRERNRHWFLSNFHQITNYIDIGVRGLAGSIYYLEKSMGTWLVGHNMEESVAQQFFPPEWSDPSLYWLWCNTLHWLTCWIGKQRAGFWGIIYTASCHWSTRFELGKWMRLIIKVHIFCTRKWLGLPGMKGVLHNSQTGRKGQMRNGQVRVVEGLYIYMWPGSLT